MNGKMKGKEEHPVARRYTVTVEDSSMQIKRGYEFHDKQRVTVYDKSIHSGEISKMVICATAHPSYGELNVTFSLDETDPGAADTYRIGKPFKSPEKLRTAFKGLESAVVSHFVHEHVLAFLHPENSDLNELRLIETIFKDGL